MALFYVCDRCQHESKDFMGYTPIKKCNDRLCDDCLKSLTKLYYDWLKKKL